MTSLGSLQTLTCSFDRASLTETCTTTRGDITATVWPTLHDAIQENQPLGARRADRVEQLIAFPAAPCRFTTDFKYDGSGRLSAMVVTVDPNAPCLTSQAVYDAWGPDGRQIHGIENGVGGDLCVGRDVSYAYDDTLRIITITRTGGSDCSGSKATITYDADGLRKSAATGAPTGDPIFNVAYQTLATGEICE